ncbi:MAG: hypothetical protein EAZ97_01150 [Bacteroidetes bacterium]|nr:MAG: hypothetical protein EAZ97_01150 [Bacteroidota bacterium]
MIQIKHDNLDNLAKRHWEAVKNYSSKKRVHYNLEHFEKNIKKYFPEFNLEMIVLAKPEILEVLALTWLSHQCKNFDDFKAFQTYYDYLTDGDKLFFYKENEKKDYSSKLLVNSLGLSVCPYCNRNFIQIIGNQRIDELDHFYPKSKYPFLALSFYNLIPSCKTCNQTFKGVKEISINPYDMPEKFKFALKIKNVDFYYKKEGFEIDFKELKAKLGLNFSVFELEKVYETHKDLILELIQKQITYSDDYIDDLFRRYEGTLFKNREDVLRHLSGNYVSESDFHLRPLSKLTHDIAQELGLL